MPLLRPLFSPDATPWKLTQLDSSPTLSIPVFLVKEASHPSKSVRYRERESELTHNVWRLSRHLKGVGNPSSGRRARLLLKSPMHCARWGGVTATTVDPC